MRHRIAVLVLVAALGLGGCGLSTALHSRTAHRALSAALCGYHAWRTAHDVKNHHAVFAAFQAWRTVHNCRRAVHR